MSGTSENVYDALHGRWHQRTEKGVVVTNRVTWKRVKGDALRQLWEASKDGGKSWMLAFDGLYKRTRQ
jgi:hypothetical protein